MGQAHVHLATKGFVAVVVVVVVVVAVVVVVVLHECLLFYVRFSVALISALALLNYTRLRLTMVV